MARAVPLDLLPKRFGGNYTEEEKRQAVPADLLPKDLGGTYVASEVDQEEEVAPAIVSDRPPLEETKRESTVVAKEDAPVVTQREKQTQVQEDLVAPPTKEEIQFIESELPSDGYTFKDLQKQGLYEQFKYSIENDTTPKVERFLNEEVFNQLPVEKRKKLFEALGKDKENIEKQINFESAAQSGMIGGQFGPLPVDKQQTQAQEDLAAPPVEVGTGELLVRGFGLGIEATKNIPTSVRAIFNATETQRSQDLLSIYDRIDNGETDLNILFPKDRFTQSISPLEQRARAYLMGDAAQKERLRQTEAKYIADNTKVIQELLPKFIEFQQKTQALSQGVPQFTDIKSIGDFNDWLAFHGAAGTTQLIPLMLTSLVTGGYGAFVLGTTYGLQEGVGARLNYILKQVEKLPEQQQAAAVSKYLAETADVTLAQAIISGQLDKMGGPVRTILKNKALKKAAQETVQQGTETATKEVAKETATQLVKRQAKQLSGEILGEAATGAGQSVTQIVGELQLQEKQGPLFTKENMVQIINDAAAEAAGVPGAKALQLTTVGAVNQAKKQINRRRQQKFLQDERVPTVVRQYMESRMGQGISFGQAYEEVQDQIYGNKNPVKDQDATGEDIANANNITDARARGYILFTSELLDKYDEYDAEKIADRAEQLMDEGKQPKAAFQKAEKEFVDNNLEQLQIQEESDLALEVLTDYDPSDADNIVFRANSLIEQGTTPAESYAQARSEFDSGKLDMPDVVRYRTLPPIMRPGDVDLTDVVTAETGTILGQEQEQAAIQQRQNPYQTTEDLLNVEVEGDTNLQLEGIQADLNLAQTNEQRMSAFERAAILAEESLASDPEALGRVQRGEKTINPTAMNLSAVLDTATPAQRNQAFNRARKEISRVRAKQKRTLSMVDPTDRAPNLLNEDTMLPIATALASGVSTPQFGRLLNIADSAPTYRNKPQYQNQRLKLLTHLALISRSPALNGTFIQASARDTLNTYEYGLDGMATKDGALKNMNSLPRRSDEVAAAKQRARKLKPYGKNEITSTTDAIGDVTRHVALPVGEMGPPRKPELVGPQKLPAVRRQRKPKETMPSWLKGLGILPSEFVGPPKPITALPDVTGPDRPVTALPDFGDPTKAQKPFTLTEEDLKEIDKDAEQINELLTQMNDLSTGETRDLARAMGDYFKKTKSREYNIGALLRNIDNIYGDKFVYLLQALQTSDIARVFKRLTRGILGPDDVDHFDVMKDVMNSMSAKRHQYIEGSKPLIEMWRQYNSGSKRGAKVLAELMNETSIEGVDPSRYKNAESAIRQDKRLKTLRKNLKEAESKPAKDKINKRIEQRKKTIDKIYRYWNELGQIDGGTGRQIYTQARDKYKQYFEDYEKLLIKTIEESGLSDADKATQIEAIKKQFQDARERVPVYFPLKRYGDFYIRVSNSGDAEMDGFYMFETKKDAKDAADEIRRNISEAGVNIADVVISEGNNKDRPIRQELTSSDAMLRNIFDVIDSKQDTTVNVDSIKNQIMQLYLATLPGQSLRTMFLNRKGTAGASQDVLRSFATTVSAVATQLPRLEYGGEARREVSALRSQIEGFPNQEKLDQIITELQDRVDMELTPEKPTMLDALATYGNKTAFLWLMSAAKSGLLQTTQFPLVVAPVMMQEFRGDLGKTKVAAKIFQYLGVFNKLGVAKSVKEWTKPTIMNSSYINKHRDKELLQRAWNAADEMGKFNTTYAADVGDLSRAPTERSKTRKGLTATYNFMTGFFHHAERITRELAYMAAFELAHEQAKGKGLKGEEAFNYAVKKALGVVDEGLFDYSQYNKPSLLRANAGTKMATQFMSFSNMMASLMVRNFANFVKPMDSKQRRDAAVVLFGVNAQAALFSGVGGFWGASIVWGTFQMMFDAYSKIIQEIEDIEAGEDETEEEKAARYAQRFLEGNPAYYTSAKQWLNKWWIPTYFGVNGTVPSAMGLDPKYAKYMQLIVEKGVISTALSIDMSNSLALDGLVIRDRPRDPEAGWFVNSVDALSNIGIFPIASVIKDVALGVGDMLEGNYLKGAEKAAPAIVKGPVRAYRRGTEGLVTYDGAKISDMDYSGFELTMMALTGGRNLEEARVVDNAYSINKFNADVNRARGKYFNAVKDAYVDLEEGKPGSVKKLRAALEKVDEWNDKYPNIDDGIFKEIKLKNISDAADKEIARRELTSAYYGVRRPAEAAENLRLLVLLRKYIGIVPDEAAIQKNLDMVNEHYQKEIQGR